MHAPLEILLGSFYNARNISPRSHPAIGSLISSFTAHKEGEAAVEWKQGQQAAATDLTWQPRQLSTLAPSKTKRGDCLVAERPSNMPVYLRDGSAQTILRAATLR